MCALNVFTQMGCFDAGWQPGDLVTLSDQKCFFIGVTSEDQSSAKISGREQRSKMEAPAAAASVGGASDRASACFDHFLLRIYLKFHHPGLMFQEAKRLNQRIKSTFPSTSLMFS